jgi:hypothetical protein
MRNRVGAATSALIPYPTRRYTPPLSEFFGGQHFKEKTLGWRVLCSELCSSGFHTFPVNKFERMAVLKTVILLENRAAHFLAG